MTTYYLRIFTSSGTQLSDGHNTWFTVELPSSELTNSSSFSLPGKTSFDPLTLSFAPTSTLEQTLLGDLAAGTQIKEIEIAGYTPFNHTTGQPGQLVDDYAYTGVSLSGLSVGAASDTLSLTYTGTQVEHFPTSGARTTASWNSATGNTQVSATTVTGGGPPLTTQTGSLEGTANLTYYVKFTPTSGAALTDDNGGNWLAMSGPSFSLTHNSKTAFDTLSLTLDQPSKASVTLLQDLEKGLKLGDVEIAAYGGNGKLVDDYTFGTVGITDATPTTPGSKTEGFSFVYGQMQEVSTTYNVTGQPQTSAPTGWDALTQKSDTSLPDTATATAPTASSSATSHDYYLRIFTSTGAQLSDGHNTWFRVELPSSELTNAFSSNLLQAGRASFDPLTLSFAPTSTLEQTLLGDLAAGTQIKEIEIAGYGAFNGATGQPGQLVDDYAYTSVSLSGLSVGASSDTLSLTYTGTQVEHFPTSGARTTASWNSATNSSQVTATTVTGGSPPVTNGSLEGTANLTYYVKFTPTTGAALTDDNGGNWLAMSGPSFSLTHNSKTAFGTLSLTLGQPSKASVTLLQDLEKGLKLGGVEIAAYGGNGKLVEDYTFGTVGITDATPTTPGSTAEGFSFVYGQMQEVSTTYNQTGQPQTSAPTGWDALIQKSDTSLPDTATATAPTASSSATSHDYYLRIFTSSGAQLSDGHNTWFTVELPSSELTDTFSPNLLQAGRASFDPLTLSFAPTSTLEQTLLGDLAAGTQIKEIEIAGYGAFDHTTGQPGQLVDDYAYTGVSLSGLSVGASSDTLSLTYTGTQVEHFPTSGARTTASWNSATGNTQVSATTVTGGFPPLQTQTGSLEGTANLTYYVKFTPTSGAALTDDNGGNWLAMSGPSFSLTHNGTTAFGTLSLTLDQPSKASVTLLQDLEKGLKLGDVEIAAYGGNGKLVDDYTFGTVGITDATPTTPGSTAEGFSFIYGQMQEVSTTYNVTGQPQTSTPTGWNALNHVAISNLVHTAPPSAPCYCPGTQIATERGDRPVESLAIGDRVITASGTLRPIKWIGRRSYSGRFAFGQKHLLPVCIKAGALEEGLPRRDLWISPHHAMYLEGVLIEARDLVNGVSILQAEKVEEVTYLHIELATHDVIIAEGALSESFIDDDSRGQFHNAHEYEAVYPAELRRPARYCAARLDEGYEVEAARRHIALRAGLRTEQDEAEVGKLRGYVDQIGPDAIVGWAQNIDHPEAPVCLDIYAGGRLLGQALANRYREDLEQAGLGSGRHAFEFTPSIELVRSTERIEVRRSLDGVVLMTSQAARIAIAA